MSAVSAKFDAARVQQRPIVPIVIAQHVEDAAVIHGTRSRFVKAAHVQLAHLRRADLRLAAHLEGLQVAGERAWAMCESALENVTVGGVFVATLRAILDKKQDRLDRLFTLAQTIPEAGRGMTAAFGWVEADALRGVVVTLLNSSDPFTQRTGLAASGMHRVDPNLVAGRWIEHASPLVRARAMRVAGELGKIELVSALGRFVHDEDPECKFWAAYSSVLLGDRQAGLDVLRTFARIENPQRSRALDLVLQTSTLQEGQALGQELARDPANLRQTIRIAGVLGDPAYIPWLIQQMTNDAVARVAGESFSLITGADLAWLDLERKPPEVVAAEPTDAPDEANVEMDEDEGLPWPDAERIQRWIAQNGSRFPSGQRHFVGTPLAREQCIEVLKNGYQRQRILAAHHLCVLDPGSVLFEWRAPAWRQAKALAALV